MPHVHSYMFLIEVELPEDSNQKIDESGEIVEEIIRSSLLSGGSYKEPLGPFRHVQCVALRDFADCRDAFSDRETDEPIYEKLARVRDELREIAEIYSPNETARVFDNRRPRSGSWVKPSTAKAA